MMSIVFLTCVFVFLLFFSFLCQVGVYRFCLSDADLNLDVKAKQFAFNSQVLLVLIAGLSFFGKWAMALQFVILIVVPLFWIMGYKHVSALKLTLLQIFFQYFFMISFLSVYHFTAFAVEKEVFRPLPSYISLPLIEPLNDEIKKVFIHF